MKTKKDNKAEFLENLIKEQLEPVRKVWNNSMCLEHNKVSDLAQNYLSSYQRMNDKLTDALFNLATAENKTEAAAELLLIVKDALQLAGYYAGMRDTDRAYIAGVLGCICLDPYTELIKKLQQMQKE